MTREEEGSWGDAAIWFNILKGSRRSRRTNESKEAQRKTHGKGNAVGTAVEALHVHVGAEETGLAILVLVGLHALEALESVVEDDGGGVELELAVLLDLRGAPALASLPLNDEHVVGEGLAKDEVLVLLELLVVLGGVDLELGGVQGSDD